MIRNSLLLLRLSRAHILREGCFRDLHSTKASLFPDVVVPPLGESISEGSVAEIVAKQGQQIKVDDVIAQLETDKVTIDCKSAHAGTLQQIKGDEEEHAGRRPMITFPPRVAPNGDRISSLPAPEADAILGRGQAQQAQQQGSRAPASAATDAPTGVKRGEPPLGPPSTAFSPLMPQEGPKQPSAGLRVSEATQYLETVPSRRGPTRAEMEAINTGGADF
ncbi:hypothetical protein DUNSADRAFT_15973 [Dunaliella salina]|uniref:Lipoyl-binding domain-containing protein n=1 Tax=Dunaliella salina TaxID=3046 RepID=A0ABQ7G4J5_DUNSA|nr:hypothetical protein DUNSADRAFT_15973 [Dunaliella salina]|eukprot:KAF5829523.1 hypothetical protein DUNSADRAFT_15973 [Dunaliella salina]